MEPLTALHVDDVLKKIIPMRMGNDVLACVERQLKNHEYRDEQCGALLMSGESLWFNIFIHNLEVTEHRKLWAWKGHQALPRHEISGWFHRAIE